MKSFFKKIFFGSCVLEKVHSPINGEILVTEDLFGNKEMKVGKVTQSGGLVGKLWNETLSKAQSFDTAQDKSTILRHSSGQEIKVQSCLILGLGCGTVAKIISEKWPMTKMVGVEIDPVVMEIGKKYFGLGKILNLNIIISNAFSAIRNSKFIIRNSKYDLIIVDLYLGQEFPKEAESNDFLNSLKILLEKDGLIIFNRLNFGGHKKETSLFREKLIQSFPYLICREIDYNLLLFASLEAQKKVYY